MNKKGKNKIFWIIFSITILSLIFILLFTYPRTQHWIISWPFSFIYVIIIVIIFYLIIKVFDIETP